MRTIWSPAALMHETLFLAAVIFVAWRMMPSNAGELSSYPESAKLAETESVSSDRAAPYSEQTRAEAHG